MMGSSGLFGGNEIHAHFFGTLGQLPEHSLAVALLVVVLTLIGVFLALGQHRVDQAGALVGGVELQAVEIKFDRAPGVRPDQVAEILGELRFG